MEPGATGQHGVAVLRRVEKEQEPRSVQESATIPLPLTEDRSVLVNGQKREFALRVSRMTSEIKNNI